MPKIRIYSKQYCPFCQAAKRLLRGKGLVFETIDLLKNPDRHQEMVNLSRRYTVPQIFFGDTHIGGYDDLLAHYQSVNSQTGAA